MLSRAQRLEEAGEWLLRLNEEARGEEVMKQWLHWCDASAQNVAAFESLQKDWHDLDALKGKAAAKRPPSHVRWAVAAGLVVALSAAAYYWGASRETPHQVVAAKINKTTTLPDGSSVVLGARTQVAVDFTGVKRSLELSQGEAYFKVRHDELRPFVVRAGAVSVTAVGTAFDVRRESDRVVVTVEEGIVEVAGAGSAWRAEAGYRVTYSLQERTALIASVEPEAVGRWQARELAYVWKPLGEVIEDVNRHSSRRMVLADEGLATLRFTGTVFTSSVDDWLKAVQEAYPVRVEEGRNGEIVLREFKKEAITR